MAKSAMSFRWVTPPSTLARRIDEYGDRVKVAVHAVAAYVGQAMQNSARANKPWADRSAAAKNGLHYAVDGFGLGAIMGSISGDALSKRADTTSVSGDKDHLVLALGHTVYYGKFLELAHGGRYAVVMSTIEGHLPMLERMLKQLLRD